MNRLWPLLLTAAGLCAAVTGRLGALTEALLQSGKEAILLCVTLGGAMCVWSGLMRVAQASGITRGVARLLRPLLRLLFPRLAPDGEAAGAIAMSITANLLGLGNSATPLGLRAMEALQHTMPDPHTAGDEMITLVVLNTAAIQLFPTTVIALLQEAGATSPTAILPAVWVTSLAVAALSLCADRLLRRKRRDTV